MTQSPPPFDKQPAAGASHGARAPESALDAWRLQEDAGAFVDRLMGAHRIKTKASTIWCAWPALRETACRFAEHVGPRFPGLTSGSSLVEDTLITAVLVYVRASKKSIEAAAAAFLQTVASASDVILARQLYAVGRGGRTVAWSCFELGIGDWMDVHGPTKIYVEDAPYLANEELLGGRDFLALKVMSHFAYGLMKAHQPALEGAAE